MTTTITRASFHLSAVALALTATLTLIACASQATPDYQGEALAIVKGSVTGTPSGSDSDAVLAWSKGGGELLGSSTRVAVTGAFPQKFALAILDQPPPESWTTTFPGEPRVAFGDIVAIGSRATPSTPSAFASALTGAVASHVVVYAEADVAAGSRLASVFGGPLAAGYHLMAVRSYTDAERSARTQCRAEAGGKDPKIECPSLKLHIEVAPGGFADEVELVLVPNAADALPGLG